eukprot:Blabericola_migrator_1__104@NODE_1026_length_5664_cov_316_922458_g706_i0_p1_GENE_NODE_1026_length_5664_cov_316_922458_g706_i0NODE_1026_length_5664_cov_316_922458_g706_i0_p1_ORF_typecomplete_len651_score65_53OHA/PF14418_6/3_3e16OSTHTH/PF12872_7/0_00022_NODE_1026_length_5664_cov_316_922458_g706_i016093561
MQFWFASTLTTPSSRMMAVLDNSLLQTLGIPPLHESDNLLLYLVILALYKEGVRPTYSEVHYKLKEYQSPWDVERSFLVYYLLQPHRYTLQNGSTTLDSNVATARLLLTQHISRSRSRKPHAQTLSTARPFQATDVVIYFKSEPTWFQGWVNLKDGENHYSLRLWSVLISFFRSCTSIAPAHSLASIFKQTRYSLAKSLQAMGPPEIREMRLGEIAHMAQLAIQHGFLCYEASTIQPTWTSYTLASMKSFQLNLKVLPNDSAEAKELIAKYTDDLKKEGRTSSAAEVPPPLRKKAFWKADEEDQSTTVSSTFRTSPRMEIPPLTDVRELKLAIKKLLSLDDCNQILLSQLRVILQTRMNINLVPWSLGYAKLSNLLIAECSDVCRLVRHGGRHVFVEACEEMTFAEETSVPFPDPAGRALTASTTASGNIAADEACFQEGVSTMDCSSCHPSSSSFGTQLEECPSREVAENSSPCEQVVGSETVRSAPPNALNGAVSEVSRFASLSGCIQNCVPLYFLDYDPRVLDYVVSGGRVIPFTDADGGGLSAVAKRYEDPLGDDASYQPPMISGAKSAPNHPQVYEADWSYADVAAIASRLRGCRLSVLFHGLPISLQSYSSLENSSSAFEELLSIDWEKRPESPSLLLSSFVDI